MPITVELTIRRLPDHGLVADLRAYLLHNHADLGSALVTINGEPYEVSTCSLTPTGRNWQR